MENARYLRLAALMPAAAGSKVKVCDPQEPSATAVKSNAWAVLDAAFQLIVRLQLSSAATVGTVVPPVQPKTRTFTSAVEIGVSKGSRRPRFAKTLIWKVVPVGTLTAMAVCESL